MVWGRKQVRAQQSVPARQLRSVALRYRWPSVRARSVQLGGLPAESPEVSEVPPEPVDPTLWRDAKLQRLEAVLFLAREPLSTRKLAELANLADGTEARTLVRRLNRLYDEAGRAFRVEEVAGGLQLLCRRKFAAWLRRLDHVPGEQRLSAPALETLAVIAYRQPVLRADIEAIRGVNCGEIIRQLMDRDLVRISGRSEELGRPYLYSTTKKFLQLFGLPNIDKLPRVETMRDVCRNEENTPEAAGAGSKPSTSPDPHQPHQPQDKEEGV